VGAEEACSSGDQDTFDGVVVTHKISDFSSWRVLLRGV